MRQNVSKVRARKLGNLALVGSAAVGTLLTASAAQAQTARDGSFSVQTFNPAPGPRNFLSTRGARTDGEMAWSAGLMANYGYRPFVVVSCESVNTDCQDVYVVENIGTADLLGSFTIFPQLQLGLRVPVTFVKGQGLTEQGNFDPDGLQAVGAGDPELEGKYRILGEPDEMLTIAGAGFVRAPLGEVTAEGNYIGDQSLVAGLRGIVDIQMGPISAAANLVGVYRGEGQVGETTLGPEFRYGVAGGYRVSPMLRVVADVFGGTKFSGDAGTNTIEVDLGAQVQPVGAPFVITAGAGIGALQGIGVPQFRALVGFLYIQEVRDRDADGIPDEMDECPTDAEDLDGFEDSNGCPDLDNDGDTIADDADKCPDAAEDPDGFQDIDGCPDFDNDGDGVSDDRDSCPDKPETKNGFKDDDGCPDEPDTDLDGVPDKEDKCPAEAEDTDGFQDTDGCPDPDNDGDGIPDDRDECVDEAETPNEFEDEDGCPDEAPAE